jgi:hypothetical protein
MKPSNILIFPSPAHAPTPARPSLRTPETAEKICAVIRENGLPDRAAAALAGLGSAALERWRQDDAGFASRLDAAREEFCNARLREIREARNPDGTLNQQAQAWLRRWEQRK